MRKFRISLIWTVAFGLLVAACGSSSDTTSSVSETTQDSGQQETTSTTTNAEGESSDGPGSQSYDDLVAAAQAEGALTIYSVETEGMLVALADAFHDEFGIEMTIVRITQAALEQRYAGERSAGTVVADVLNVSNPSLVTSQPDWFVPMTDDIVPDDYPDEYRSERHVTASIFLSTIYYDTEVLAEADLPVTWEDVTKPEFRGNCVIVDPRASPIPTALYDRLEQEYGVEFLEAVAAQDCALVDSASPGAQQVAAGAALLAWQGGGGAHIAPLVAEGAPMGVIVPTPIVGGTNEQVISTDAPHPNAALLYTNWRLQRDAFQVVCDLNLQVSSPSAESLDGCLDLPVGFERLDLSSWTDDARKNHLYDALGLTG